MSTFLFTLGILVLVMLGLGVGVLAGRSPIKGSCGGLASATREDCPICGGNATRCEQAPGGSAQVAPGAARRVG